MLLSKSDVTISFFPLFSSLILDRVLSIPAMSVQVSKHGENSSFSSADSPRQQNLIFKFKYPLSRLIELSVQKNHGKISMHSDISNQLMEEKLNGSIQFDRLIVICSDKLRR